VFPGHDPGKGALTQGVSGITSRRKACSPYVEEKGNKKHVFLEKKWRIDGAVFRRKSEINGKIALRWAGNQCFPDAPKMLHYMDSIRIKYHSKPYV